jgi:hypothetical protein
MPVIELNNAKVFKFFGAHPERGRLMKNFTTMSKTAGMMVKNKVILNKAGVVVKYLGYEWRPNPIQVWPVLALKNVGANRWEVFVQAEYLPQALRWLHDFCVFQAPQKKRRKRGYKKQSF